MMEVEHVFAVRNVLGEGPMWHVGERALYWVDINSGCFYRYTPSRSTVERFDVGVLVGTVVFRQGGGLMLATRDGFASWDFATQRLDFWVDPEAGRPDSRFNDGAVDANGRFWAGTMDTKQGGPVSALYRLDPDGTLHTMQTGITVSNGIAWSPDQRTMYYTDTRTGMIAAYEFDVATGRMGEKRPFAIIPPEAGYPDGHTVDSEGCLWGAHWDGWRITRYDPDGKVMLTIPLPVQRPTSCMFGGPDLTDLYITSAAIGLTTAQRAAQPQAGDLFRIRTTVRGRPEPHFAG
ncbi:MAG: SMP-30/gluconolactonase/LRE family protein [Chloroflexota bacterium]